MAVASDTGTIWGRAFETLTGVVGPMVTAVFHGSNEAERHASRKGPA